MAFDIIGFIMSHIMAHVALFMFFIALLSYEFAKYSWHETYRPIVTAQIKTHVSGDQATEYNIVVYNTGNRPATYIRLHTDQKKLEKLFKEDTSDPMREEVKACFSTEGIIPLLQPGACVSNGFGFTRKKESTLKYGSEIPVTILKNDTFLMQNSQ